MKDAKVVASKKLRRKESQFSKEVSMFQKIIFFCAERKMIGRFFQFTLREIPLGLGRKS